MKHDTLPWEYPKSRREDPEAAELTRRLLECPGYRMAELDTDFLQSYDARGVRLQLDYMKAELAMAREGVEHTIVVFGSARIRERKAALKRLETVRKKLESDPENACWKREYATAERMLELSVYYDDARRFGRLVARSGNGPQDNRVILMTGGGPGIMEAANRGAYDEGAKSIGLNIHLPHEQFPNPYIAPELCFQFHYFAIRKLHFFQRAHALVAYPGGFGTLDELFEILTLIQTRKTPLMPVVMVGKEYWERLLDFDFLIGEGMVDPKDMELFEIVDDAEEAWSHIKQWHIRRKTHLYFLYHNGQNSPEAERP